MAGCDFNPIWFWTNENISNVLNILPELNKPIFHICSGCSSIGDIRLDRSYINSPEIITNSNRLPCNVQGDFHKLPFKSGVAGSIICDPPYKYDFTKPELISELVRICKPRGKIVFIAPWIPNHKNITVLNTALWNVGSNGAYHKIRTMFYKSNAQLEDYFGCAEQSNSV